MATDSMVHDQRKRTLDALERRFSVAKSELLHQQEKNKKRTKVGDEKVPYRGALSASIASAKQHIDASTPSGISSNKDLDAHNPEYSPLNYPVHENLLMADVETVHRKGSRVEKILHELLQKGDSSQKYMQGSRSLKIDNIILLDKFVQARCVSTGSQERALQQHSKRSKRRMSIKQHKKIGSFSLPQDLQKYESFKPMHEMWKSYIKQLLKNVGNNQLANCLLGADLHGAIILVVQCKNTDLNGVHGFMIRETAETFGVITEDDKLRVVPKKLSVFVFQVDCWKITLLGDKLTSRNIGF